LNKYDLRKKLLRKQLPEGRRRKKRKAKKKSLSHTRRSKKREKEKMVNQRKKCLLKKLQNLKSEGDLSTCHSVRKISP